MKQRIPNISLTDIQRVISRDFTKDDQGVVIRILEEYKSETHKGQYRVWAAILKLANGQVDKVSMYVEKAQKDFRDILSLAEYPLYSKHIFNDDLSDDKKNKLIKNDWKNYQDWLSC